jgi:hypothetical protein
MCQLSSLFNHIEAFGALSRVNIRNSPGPHNLPNWFSRDFVFAITESICHIFNASISMRGTERWMIATLRALFVVCAKASDHVDHSVVLTRTTALKYSSMFNY